ncbi:hypothetical protein HELRODRAFT_184513 [Helobdella robusta]|uniref:WSC domain-containing protein n=1 Tax=Helobdella robusta TaxID=6412 RepID=T1FLD2_HELRO|nr:hypothetical protein HELRODRAFT_184513 [Helobdella robusta]ESN92299.1 hypothetical protein HELRODRAFT_184513 [Helobdella robusta]
MLIDHILTIHLCYVSVTLAEFNVSDAYIGCFKFISSNNSQPHVVSSIIECSRTCTDLGSTHMIALRRGRDCFCVDRMDAAVASSQCHAILPVNMGGLGLGVVAELAPSAFLSSAAATAALQDKILPMDVAYQDDLRLETFRRWCTVYGDIMDINVCSQKKWNEPSLNVSKSKLEELNDSPSDKARLMAVRSELGSAWLRAIPSTACGTRLVNGSISEFMLETWAAGGVRLQMLVWGGCFSKANIPAVKEPAGLLSESNFRPDGYTLVPWSQGCCLSWDVTFPHTLAERYINYTAMEQGSAAVKAADFKNTKYKDLNDNTSFCSDLCGDIWPSG